MPKNIQPLDPLFQSPEQLPDRTELSHSYGEPLKKNYMPVADKLAVQPDAPDINQADVMKSSWLINLLVAVPYIISYVSIATIFTLNGADDVGEAMQNRLTIILLTIPALAPWLLSLWLLGRILSTYYVSLFVFIAGYLFFILPAMSLSLGLRLSDTPDWILLTGTYIFSQLYALLLLRALTSLNDGTAKYVPVATMSAITIIAAIVIDVYRM